MKINSMNSLLKFLSRKDDFNVYRGQSDSEWELESTMTRLLKSNKKIDKFGKAAETATITRFRRDAHLYDDNFHHFKVSKFATLTYIQHHGAPTRLLDFTNSKYIALFFAFDGVNLNHGNKYVRIWCTNYNEVNSRTKELFDIKENIGISSNPNLVWDTHISKNNHDGLFFLLPSLNSKRSHIQKGWFLCSGNIQKSIHEIYTKSYSDLIEYVDINKSLYYDINELLNQVNICHRTLYGGIDGYAKDLKNSLLLIRS